MGDTAADQELRSSEPRKAAELSDEQLAGVTGGLCYTQSDGKYFRYIGSNSEADFGKRYLCPKCGRPVRYGVWLRFCCDSCDETWYYEHTLVPNTASGVWEEISKADYDAAMTPGAGN